MTGGVLPDKARGELDVVARGQIYHRHDISISISTELMFQIISLMIVAWVLFG